MKKLILSFITFFVSLGLHAQNSQTLTTGRNAYRATDQLVKQQVAFKDPGSSGKNLNWDFSTLQSINENYTLNYFIPDSTNMTRLCGQEHNTRYYFRQQHDSLQAVGYENSTTYMEYTAPELRMHFPFVYGDTLFSYFTGNGEYCHRIPLAVKGYTRIIVDAEGDLKLPEFETVKKALRVHTLRHYTETGKDSMEMTLDTYSWYAAGIRYPVFESIKTTLSRKKGTTKIDNSVSDSIVLDKNENKKSKKGESTNDSISLSRKVDKYEKSEIMKDTIAFSTSFFYPPELQTSQVKTAPIPTDSLQAKQGAAAVFTEAQLMPNPVTDNLYINFKLTRAAKVWFTVHNNTGIPLCQTSPKSLEQGYNNSTVRMSGMIPGVYSLYVHVDDMVMRLNVVKK